MLIRINKFLAKSGLCSRRKADVLISSELIKINGRIAKLTDKLNPDKDIVTYAGKKIKFMYQNVYFALNKPPGYVCTNQNNLVKKTITQIVPLKFRLYPVGRLDKNTTGLIILTNDGKFANYLTHPKYKHQKEYYVECSIGHNKKMNIYKIKTRLNNIKINGVHLREGLAKIDSFKILQYNFKKNRLTLSIILHQGFNHQIKRILAKIGLEIIQLKRIRINKLKLGNLKEGEYKKISKNDVLNDK